MPIVAPEVTVEAHFATTPHGMFRCGDRTAPAEEHERPGLRNYGRSPAPQILVIGGMQR